MPDDPRNLADITGLLVRIIRQIIPVLEALALLVFLWGIVKFIAKSSESDITDGKKLIIWGIIALFVLVSFQVIIGFFYGDVGFSDRELQFPPLLPTANGAIE